jgi:RNA polymerase sigma-70 factor (ECF subfamily)
MRTRSSPPETTPIPRFPSTHWSLIDRSTHADRALRRQALGELLVRYWPALRGHLVARKGIDPDAAEDLLQGFVTSKVLEQGVLARVVRAKGKFRTWLLTALDRYVISQRRYHSAAKRAAPGVVSLDASPAVPSDSEGADVFDLAWAREVLAEALRRLEAECTASQRPGLWRLFACRVLAPALDDAPAVPYEQVLGDLGYSSATQASNALVTVKRMFRRHLHGVIGEYAGSDDAIQEEMEDLHRILAQAGPA